MPIPTFIGPWPRYPLLYEINTRVWLNELSTKAGKRITLDKVPNEEIERITRLGFQGVWLMGVWIVGPEAIQVARTYPDHLKEYAHILPDYTQEDIIGSPYAVAKYEVCPKLGGPEGLASIRERFARQGIHLLLDFVPNHTSKDHHLVDERPEVFVPGSLEDAARDPASFFKTRDGHVLAHGRDPYFAAWTDTAQINYGSAAGRAAMKDALFSIAAQCDGVRCDMAMLILPEIIERVWGSRLPADWNRKSFWKEAILDIRRKHPNFLFMAESYWNMEWQLQEEGFQFTYDKTLYDRLRSGDHNGVRSHLTADPRFQSRCARFVENHDEPRSAASFGPARSRSAATVSFFSPGLKLFHEGQLEGRRAKLPVQLGRRPVESEDVEMAIFYEKMLSVLQDPLFQDGNFSTRQVHAAGWGDASNESLVALTWSPPAERSGRHSLGFLIVVNLNPWRAYGRIPLSSSTFANGKQYVFVDRLDGKRYERQGSELVSPGLYIALEAHQQHMFEIFPK